MCSSRARPPWSATRSAVVGVVATCGAVPGANGVPILGSSRVVKFFETPVDNWDGWTSSPSLLRIFSLTWEASALVAIPSPAIRDRKVGGSNPLAPTTVSPRRSFPTARRRVDGACSISGLGSNRVAETEPLDARHRARRRAAAAPRRRSPPVGSAALWGLPQGCGGPRRAAHLRRRPRRAAARS